MDHRYSRIGEMTVCRSGVYYVASCKLQCDDFRAELEMTSTSDVVPGDVERFSLPRIHRSNHPDFLSDV